jgi:hypothetical protein
VRKGEEETYGEFACPHPNLKITLRVARAFLNILNSFLVP